VHIKICVLGETEFIKTVYFKIGSIATQLATRKNNLRQRVKNFST